MREPRLIVLLAVSLFAAASASAQICDLTEIASISTPGTPSTPAILGDSAYVAAGSVGIVRVDISDPAQPVLLDSFATQGQAEDIVGSFLNNLLVVADGSAGVSSYWLYADGTPSHQGTLSLGETAISIFGQSTSYIVGTQEGTLSTVSADIGGPPTKDGSIALGGPVLSVLQRSQYVYCALANGGMATVHVLDRTNPSLVWTMDLGGSVLSVARDINVLLFGVEGLGLVSASVDGADVTAIGTLALAAAPTRLIAWSGRAYMVAPDGGLLIADSALGSQILQIGEIDLPGANGLALVGETVIVGRGSQGLSTVDVSACTGDVVDITIKYVPAAARATGAANTFWVTDVAVTNLTSGTATYQVAYLPKDQDNSNPINASFAIEPGHQTLLNDIMSSVFGLDSGNGALRFTVSSADVKVTSRTYNAAGASGTYGQFIPAIDSRAALGTGMVGSLIQLQENNDFRANVGLVNVTETQTEVDIDLCNSAGELLEVKSVNLDPYEMTQLNQAFSSAGGVDSGYALVRVISDHAAVLAYASVIDNQSGDPIAITAEALSTGTPFQPTSGFDD